jgi:Flp pilus assembly pilin Flp
MANPTHAINPWKKWKAFMNASKKTALVRFIKDESGQGTAEYALILLIVLMMANTFKSQFKRALTGLLGKLEQQMTEAGEE